MFESPLLLLVAIAALAPSLKFSAKALVLARLSWSHCVAAALLMASLMVPAYAMAQRDFNQGLWLWLAAMGIGPHLAGWYLRARASAPHGGSLGRQRATEMSLYAVAMATTAGIAAYGAFVV